MKKRIALGLGFAFMPTLVAFAQTITNVTTGITWAKALMNTIIGFFIALAVFFIIWGIFDFVRSAGDEAKRTEGRDRMIYGIIGVVLMVSVYGLIGLLTGSINFGATGASSISAPAV